MKILVQGLKGPPHERVMGCAFQFAFVHPADRTTPNGSPAVSLSKPLDPAVPENIDDTKNSMQVEFWFTVPEGEWPDDDEEHPFWLRAITTVFMTPDEARALAGSFWAAADEFQTDPGAN
jgi:hypothetical protein